MPEGKGYPNTVGWGRVSGTAPKEPPRPQSVARKDGVRTPGRGKDSPSSFSTKK